MLKGFISSKTRFGSFYSLPTVMMEERRSTVSQQDNGAIGYNLVKHLHKKPICITILQKEFQV